MGTTHTHTHTTSHRNTHTHPQKYTHKTGVGACTHGPNVLHKHNNRIVISYRCIMETPHYVIQYDDMDADTRHSHE